MVVTIKTPLITLEVEDQQIVGHDNLIKRRLPELNLALESIITEAVRLHKEIQQIEIK